MNHGCDDYDARRAWKHAARALAGAWSGHRRGGPSWGGGPGGPFGPGGPWGRGRRGGPGRGRQFGRAELRLILLKLIAEQPRHGYDLIKAMEELSGGHYSSSPGVVYPALAMLSDEGLIAEQASEDQRRKFAVTGPGEGALADEAEQVEQAMARLTGLAEHAERHRAPSIERAAVSLFTAVGQRMAEGGEDGDLPHRIAEILDEAAQRIERL